MKQPSYPCSCVICKRLTSSLGIDTHFMRTHGSEKEKEIFIKSTESSIALYNKRVENYNQNPKMCKQCGRRLSYDSRKNSYCSNVCSAIFNNKERYKNGWRMSNITKDNISKKLKKNDVEYVGEYSRLYICNCKFCGISWVSKNKISVCPDCSHLKWKNNKDQYSFKFNVYDYSDLFDIDLIKKIGWVSFGGKRVVKRI